MLNTNETPVPPVEEVPLDAKLIPVDPAVGQEFQTTITVDDIDPSSSLAPAASSSSAESASSSSEQDAGDTSSLLAPITSFIRGSTVGAAISARLSDPPQSVRSIQPWDKFIGDKTKYSIPGLHYILPRLQSNFKQFRYNYLAIAVVLLFLFALLNFNFLLLVIVMGALWGYVFWWRSEPVAPFGFEIPQKIMTIALSVVTVLVFYFVLGFKLFWALIAVAVFSFIHSLLYISQEETIDFTRPV